MTTSTYTPTRLGNTSGVNQFDLYKTFATTTKKVDRSNKYTAGVNINDLFSMAYIKNDSSMLSREQWKDFDRYNLQADTTLDADMVQLDEYLGSLLPQEVTV